MVNDPIGDMLTQIRNAVMARKRLVRLPYSRLKHEVAKILAKEGYLESCETEGEGIRKNLTIILRFIGKEPVLTNLTRKSKPGLRVYKGYKNIPRVVGGMGTAIISTPHGVMTGEDAKKKCIGGELLCEVW